ncbi:MBOAT family O-acyltransferase [Marinicella sediminis]|uniref:Probable alginate O-acetylase n=1 Tax=Marinicella sediminis TaxID=1792834 RepID=A0ABV7JCZ7_9GAMM|nr:MBOAT family O-acyltransferase [Marinicella sediminis]
MLFNSLEYLLIFLPLMTLVYALFIRMGHKVAGIYWLIAGSFLFYTWWKVEYLLLLLGSICFNYLAGQVIMKQRWYARWVMILGIVVNLVILGYYKYSQFFLGIFGLEGLLEQVILPLAISFFTFQQIAYLVDAKQGKIEDNTFRSYVLFVAFFPQLISGPIVHHKDVMSQFSSRHEIKLTHKIIAAGITIIIIGLFKKVVLADGLAPHANWVFELSHQGQALSAWLAWSGSLAYTLQIYFDFSGYSDIAIGSALLFGIQLPINFNSPYKSRSIIAFWRRWHITLSAFLRDYLYIQMGGNRKGVVNRYVFLMITMLLGGMWHGAGWIYIIWGGLHGLALVVNHLYRQQMSPGFARVAADSKMYDLGSWIMTFLFVNLTFIVFKSESVGSILTLASSLLNFGMDLPGNILEQAVFVIPGPGWLTLLLVLLLCVVVKTFPNTQEVMDYQQNHNYASTSSWNPGIWFTAIITLMVFISLFKIIGNGYSEFIYRFF